MDELRAEDGAVVAAAQAGDASAFTELVERYRRELQVHCYRMLGSFEDSEDLVQETFLRAWRKRESFQGRSTFRAWLYRIATNACLDFLDQHPRHPLPREVERANDPHVASPPAEIRWLQPYPDRLLEPIAPGEAEPDAAVVGKETIELAFLTAVQHLPPGQRAALILRDVLGWSAKETAALLGTSVASVKSALQRARPVMRAHLPERRLEWAPSAEPTPQERALVRRFMDAHERVDTAAFAELLSEDVRMTMPPIRSGSPIARPSSASPSTRSDPARRSIKDSGEACPNGRTGSRQSRGTSGCRGTPSTGPRCSTCCGSRTRRSPRSPPSSRTCSPRSVCP